MNRFNLLGLDWDPDWWMMADAKMEDGWWDWDDLFSRRSMFLVRQPLQEHLEGPYGGQGNIVFVDSCEHIGGDYIPDAWHLPTLCTHGGGVGWALQTAAKLGHNPIYLVGCDLYRYRGPDDVDINHFHPGYCAYRTRKSTGEEMVGPAQWENINETMRTTHRVARDAAAEMGITIYNATVGGALEVYERVDINTVLNGKE